MSNSVFHLKKLISKKPIFQLYYANIADNSPLKTPIVPRASPPRELHCTDKNTDSYFLKGLYQLECLTIRDINNGENGKARPILTQVLLLWYSLIWPSACVGLVFKLVFFMIAAWLSTALRLYFPHSWSPSKRQKLSLNCEIKIIPSSLIWPP